MLDQEAVKRLQKVGLVLGFILIFFIGFVLGGHGKVSPKAVKETPKQVIKEEVQGLTQKEVEDFLIAYYTKKDLEANRQIYRPFMTASLYQQEMDLENDPINQAYKGYIVDFKYKSSSIYIDQESMVALVKVQYTNTLLAEKGNYERSQRDVVNEVALQLQYVKQGGKYLVNQKTPITLSALHDQGPDYPDYGHLTQTTTETEESNGQETDTSGTEEENR
ncbi:hypothetical protein [Streptococcus ovuberis]|uniref:Parvulin-like peptidyl-prolyl isomerase n=1 Tax=Streptococcus ovuberis TaxID=1936207 RepID=A0A7X6MXS3_9STRE|nr:hypothetical protein [Streptococcus ovuberis]NKZ19694.1 hypothetical protein [Streptococcus ovuberis]